MFTAPILCTVRCHVSLIDWIHGATLSFADVYVYFSVHGPKVMTYPSIIHVLIFYFIWVRLFSSSEAKLTFPGQFSTSLTLLKYICRSSRLLQSQSDNYLVQNLCPITVFKLFWIISFQIARLQTVLNVKSYFLVCARHLIMLKT